MAGLWQGGGQQHMRHPFYRIHPQLVHQSGSAHSYGLGAVSVPGSSSGFVETSSLPGFVPATVAPRAPIISHPPTITYRPIRLSDLEVLQEIHEALFPIKWVFDTSYGTSWCVLGLTFLIIPHVRLYSHTPPFCEVILYWIWVRYWGFWDSTLWSSFSLYFLRPLRSLSNL